MLGRRETLTVADDGGVDDQGQKGLLVGSSVVLQQSGGVVVADGHIRRALSDGPAQGGGNDKSFEEHSDGEEAIDAERVKAAKTILYVYKRGDTK